MRIPRTFTLPVKLVEQVNKIPSGERSRFVEEALERALAERRAVSEPKVAKRR